MSTGLSWIDGPSTAPDIYATALEWRAAETAVLPTRSDGTEQSKAPGVTSWKQYQKIAPDDEQLTAWFGNGIQREGLGIICGKVSKNLDMFEFEGRAVTEGVLTRFIELTKERGLEALWERVWRGYTERTPSGGLHTFYRLADGEVAGSTALAHREETATEMAAREPTENEKKKGQKKPRPKTLIETRGEGGFSVTAPSNGRTHPTGRAWEIICGGIASIAVITVAERDALWEVARECDLMPVSVAVTEPKNTGETRPVQTSAASLRSWRDILEPHGWTYAGDDAKGDQCWTRPGKDAGTSATTHENGGLWVFSSNTDFMDITETPISKAAASAVLNDGMDAAEALATYGTAQEANEAEEKALGWPVPDDRQLATQNGSEPSATQPFTDETEANAWAKRQHPASFFTKDDGLLARKLGGAVVTMGALAAGIDGRMWAYRHGVYRPEHPKKPVVRARCTRLLKDSYRRSYSTAVEDTVWSAVPDIDCEPLEQYLNVRNGLLDWRTGELYAHSPDIMSTVQLDVPWDGNAVCPWFDWWLPQVVPADCIELVWELIGYLCYSGNPLHTAVMLTGSGRNGKGTLLRVILAILGKANVTSASLADLVGTRFTTATLFGKLANIAGDIDATYMENTALLKSITGMDQISAEHKGKDRFDFTPWAVPVFSANKIPASADTTAGYLSRWLVIPFPNSFEGKEDRTIEAKLHAELPGILAAGIRRLPALLARGQFSQPTSARDAKADFSRKVDQVRYWMHECCEPWHTPYVTWPRVTQASVYQAYKRWVDGPAGGKALGASEFYSRLAAIGVRVYRDSKGRWVDGTIECEWKDGKPNGPSGYGIRVIDECWSVQPGYSGTSYGPTGYGYSQLSFAHRLLPDDGDDRNDKPSQPPMRARDKG